MFFESVSAEKLAINMRELSRRLGAPIGTVIDGAEALMKQLALAAKPSYVAIRVKLKRECGAIYLGATRSESKSLAKLCLESDECFVLVATLGVGVDRLILKSANISPRDAFVIDAMADALIEALCDYAEARVCEGLSTTGRFSPGYGDLELSLGKEIISLTDAERTLGIKLTLGGLMVPKKSVNAIIAIRNEKND